MQDVEQSVKSIKSAEKGYGQLTSLSNLNSSPSKRDSSRYTDDIIYPSTSPSGLKRTSKDNEAGVQHTGILWAKPKRSISSKAGVLAVDTLGRVKDIETM